MMPELFIRCTSIRDASRAILCPFWARFFQRPDGFWMAYCSKEACEEMEARRPGFLLNQDFPRSDKCLIGYNEISAEGAPVVIKGRGQQAYTYFGAHEVSDQFWEDLVGAFIDWVPRNDLDPEWFSEYL